LMKLKGLVEKPTIDEAPSTSAVVGRYILHASVLKTLEKQPPGRGGEIQLTDALVQQIEKPGLYGYRFGGKRFDCGSKRGFLVANIHFGLR
jgi:UTP--glucose-1-phosphate uridylyltransferase